MMTEQQIYKLVDKMIDRYEETLAKGGNKLDVNNTSVVNRKHLMKLFNEHRFDSPTWGWLQLEDNRMLDEFREKATKGFGES